MVLLVRKKLAAVAMAATGLFQPSKRLLGLEMNIFYLVRKNLAVTAMAATGLIQPPKRVLGLELNIFSPFSGKKNLLLLQWLVQGSPIPPNGLGIWNLRFLFC